MPTPITPDRIDALRKHGICGPALEWLQVPGRCYEDLSAHPEWAYLSARALGGDVALLQEVVIAHGSPELRRKFAYNVKGADMTRLLAGLERKG